MRKLVVEGVHVDGIFHKCCSNIASYIGDA